MSWIIYFVLLIAVLLLIMRNRFFQLPGIHRAFPLLFFLVKIIASFAVWWIYTVHYPDRKTADIWKYFDDAKIMHASVSENAGDYLRMITGIGDDKPSVQKYYHSMNHWDQQFDNHLLNDAHLMIRINAVLWLFSGGNYHLHSLFFCLLAFIGLCALYKALYRFLPQWKWMLALILFLFPSLVFWTSGTLKETLMIFALGIFLLHFVLWLDDRKIKRLFILFLALLLLFFTKFYIIAALLPSSFALLWTWKNANRIILKYLLSIAVFTGLALCVRFVSPDHDPLKVLALKQRDFVNVGTGGTRLYNDTIVVFIKGDPGKYVTVQNDSVYTVNDGTDYMFWYHFPDFSDTFFVKNSHDRAHYKLLNEQVAAGSLIETHVLEPTLLSFLIATPSAITHSVFRPYIWESKDLLMIVPALENLLLILLLVIAILHRKTPEKKNIALFLFTFSILLLWIMGLTTPVLGALVRYRIAAFPFLLIALLMFIDKNRLFGYKTNAGNQ